MGYCHKATGEHSLFILLVSKSPSIFKSRIGCCTEKQEADFPDFHLRELVMFIIDVGVKGKVPRNTTENELVNPADVQHQKYFYFYLLNVFWPLQAMVSLINQLSDVWLIAVVYSRSNYNSKALEVARQSIYFLWALPNSKLEAYLLETRIVIAADIQCCLTMLRLF